MVCMGVWAWWCIRETNGIPIEEMDALFGAVHARSLDHIKDEPENGVSDKEVDRLSKKDGE